MDKDVQELGAVGMDEVIQADSEIVTGAEGSESGTDSVVDESKSGTAAADQTGVSFYDAKDVPEELRPTFKEMQKAFTQKTQALSAQVKDAESAQYHAKLFRDLMGDQRVVTYLEELERSGGGVGASPDQQVSGGYSSEDTEEDPKVAELRRQVQMLQGAVNRTRQKQQVTDEKSVFIAAHPDWEKYRGGMEKAMELDRTRGFEDAYNWAFVNSYRAKVVDLKRQKARASAGVEKPGPGAETTSTQKVDSFNDALRAALDEHGMSRKEFGV